MRRILNFVNTATPWTSIPLIRLGARKNLLSLMRTFSKIYGPGGTAYRFWHRHHGTGGGAGKDPAAVQRQPAGANRRALAALDDDAHVQRTRQNNFRGLEFFARVFRELKLEYVPSSANFVLLRVGEGSRVFDAMQKLGVITRPMGGYQLPWSGSALRWAPRRRNGTKPGRTEKRLLGARLTNRRQFRLNQRRIRSIKKP